MKSRLSKTAIVTGGAKRLGHAVAMHLAEQGYNIALHYNESKPEAVETAKNIQKKRVRCELFACDLANEREVAQVIPNVRESFKDLNLLVNCASLFLPTKLGENFDLFKKHWDINFKAPYILSTNFQKHAKKGHIINFIDTNVIKHTTKYQDYLLTKQALQAFTQMAAAEWGPDIRVNGIAPGMILPPVNGQPDTRAKRAKKIPLRRVGHPRYIVQTLQFLIDNDYITGQIFSIDGGENLV